MEGTVYLLHFSPRYQHAGHYTGWALDVEKRVGEHLAANGKASPLVKAALAAGCTVTLARTWEGVDRNFERRLKKRGGAARHCPVCRGEA